MLIGAQLPGSIGPDQLAGLPSFVRALDDEGFDAIWVSDHIVIPSRVPVDDDYPYAWRYDRELDDLFPEKSHLEAISLLGFLAAATSRALLGVAVLVLPVRNAVVTAKQLVTLDWLSGGRLVVGLGAGWMRQEFNAIGADYERRGAMLTEQIAVMQQLWTGEATDYAGEFHHLEAIHCLPAPLNGTALPLWLGGHSEPALRRCARYGSGWIASEISPDGFRESSVRLDDLLVAEGREPGSVVRAVATRLKLSGDLSEARALVAQYRDAGCEHLIATSTTRRTLAENLDRFRRLRHDVAA